jgi:hypothetical protein
VIPFSAQELHAFLRYDRKTGALYWRVQPARCVAKGSPAGHLHPSGYVMVQIQGKIHGAHRLVWKMHYGEDPDTIDHKDGVRHNNKIANLRSVTRTKNLQLHRKTRRDSSTGLLGVSYRRDCGKYQARLQVDGVSRSLGTYATPEAAHAAYVAAKMEV